jgi:hypothetical protein
MSVTVYNPTYVTIINRALRIVGAYNAGGNPRAEQANDALETLCMMLKEWQVDGSSWLVTPFQLPLVAGQASYPLGPDGTAQYLPALTTLIGRPTRVKNLRRKNTSGVEVPLGEDGAPISRQEYIQLPNKTVQGTVVQAYYDPQLVDGVLYVWPVPSTGVTDVIVGDCDRPIQVPTLDTDTLDIPMELVDPVTFCLAERIWWEYPGNGADYQLLAQRAQVAKETVSSYDRETAPTQYQPGWR